MLSAAAGRWWADLRVLGRAAPRRVLQEVGLRSGLTGRRFELAGAKAARSRATLTPPPFAPPAPVPPAAGERALAQADLLLAGELVVFGRTVPFDAAHGPLGDWHRDPISEVRWPADRPWWRIDLRGSGRAGDVKWVWEAARHRHLVVLARAAHLRPDDRRAAGALSSGLVGWTEAVPLERSVHWISNLELALRSLSWLQALALAPHAIEGHARSVAERELRVVRRHLEVGLARTRGSMPNNHLVGDLVGLAVLQRSFGDEEAAGRTDAELLDLLQVEVRPDGSTVEESLSYHRFVLELLALRVLAGGAPDEVRGTVGRLARWLCRLGVLEGTVPQHGDWDEGRAVTAGGDVHDLAGSTRLGLALAGEGAPAGWREQHDEVAWHTDVGEPMAPDAAEADGNDLGGGVARVQRGEWTVWLRASAGGWHGHADHTAVVVHHRGRLVVGDPGTGAYNGPLAERTWFRSSAAHDVVVLDGVDQLEPHRQFRWRHTARAVVGPPVLAGDAVLAWAAHDAYARLDPARTAVRVVLVTAEGVLVLDWIDPATGDWALALPLAPGVHHDDGVVHVGDQALAVRLPPGATTRVESTGWSATYGTSTATDRLVALGSFGEAPVTWSVGIAPDAAVHPSISVGAGPLGARLLVGADPDSAVEVRWS